MNGESAEQRWKKVSVDWGIEHEDVAGMEIGAVLQKLGELFVGGSEATIFHAGQVLLADPEDSNTRKRPCFRALCDEFGDEWRQAGVSKRSPWVLQALLVSAWPSHGLAASAGALFESAWLGRLSLGRQADSLDEWRRRVTNATLEIPQRPKAEDEKKLDVLQPATQTALLELVGHVSQGVGFDVYGPHLLTLLRALHHDMLTLVGVKEKKRLDRCAPHIAHFQRKAGSEKWTFNHYAKNLITILKPMVEQCINWGYPIPWQAYNHLSNHQEQAYLFQQVSYQLLDVITSIIHAISEHGQFARLRKRTKTEPPRGELDLLWWGQARYCHLLHTPYRKITKARSLLLASMEAAQRSISLSPEPAAAFLVQVISDLGLDVNESRSLFNWMSELRNTLDGTAEQGLLQMRPAFADLVAQDALGLPVSYVRRLAGKKDPLSLEDVRKQVALNLDTQLDRGDWASWIFREFRLELMLSEAP